MVLSGAGSSAGENEKKICICSLSSGYVSIAFNH